MTSLFSVFDPSFYYLLSPWVVIISVLVSFSGFFLLASGSLFSTLSSLLFVTLEFNSVVKPNNKKGVLLFLMSFFVFIFISNFVALFPSVFTVTGHLLFSLSLALIYWVFLLVFLVSMNFKSFISHLVPVGTPGLLMSFMVLVELVSNLIRPITLSVRLTANMVAGHLLMGLLGGFIVSLSVFNVLIFSLVGLILTMLELAVSFIQGYVFLTLFSLYSEESH